MEKDRKSRPAQQDSICTQPNDVPNMSQACVFEQAMSFPILKRRKSCAGLTVSTPSFQKASPIATLYGGLSANKSFLASTCKFAVARPFGFQTVYFHL